jgi:hypothetical protein
MVRELRGFDFGQFGPEAGQKWPKVRIGLVDL